MKKEVRDSCKNCGKDNNNGTNFCSRKCRMDWIREHNIKGGKKKAQKAYEKELMSYGSGFDNCSCQNEGEGGDRL